jgi:hypothetical protein
VDRCRGRYVQRRRSGRRHARGLEPIYSSGSSRRWRKLLPDSLAYVRRSADLEFVFACSQIRKQGKRPTYRPIETINNTSWQKARKRAKLPQVRVHDLKHTFGRRLRAAGVSFEDRQSLLGHKSGRMTTHYSAAELSNLIEAAEKACQAGSRKSPALAALKQKAAGAERSNRLMSSRDLTSCDQRSAAWWLPIPRQSPETIYR